MEEKLEDGPIGPSFIPGRDCIVQPVSAILNC